MQAHWTSCKLMELHASSGKCIHAHGSACNTCIHSGTFWNILEHSAYILEHFGTFCMPSVTFWNILHALCNIMEHSVCILEHSGIFCMASGTFCIPSETFCMHSGTFWNILVLYWLHTVKEFQLGTQTDGQTDEHTLGLVELRLRS